MLELSRTSISISETCGEPEKLGGYEEEKYIDLIFQKCYICTAMWKSIFSYNSYEDYTK